MSRLLNWLSEECCGLLPLAYPTGGGDHDVIWTVIRYQMAEPCEVTIGQGRTAAAAIEDAMKDPEDPTRWDYVPPQFRDPPRAEKETSSAPAGPDEETPCPKREDGMHCECWYGGNPCCGCGREDILDGRAKPPCSAANR